MIKQIALFLSLAHTTLAVQLTPDNWDAETAGKTVFIKFFAPWCGHCKAMAPDWEALMNDFAGSTNALVAEVDCTVYGDELCAPHEIEGFPTLKFGDPSDLMDYQGPREYDALKSFADENLKPTCSVDNIDLCDSDKKKLIETYLNMPDAELEKLYDEEEAKLTELQEKFDEDLEKLQETFNEIENDMISAMEEVKRNGLSMMKTILKSKEASIAAM